MEFELASPQEKTLIRVRACSYTARAALEELEDPQEQQLRVDLLLEAEDMLLEATRLVHKLRDFVWDELDKQNEEEESPSTIKD